MAEDDESRAVAKAVAAVARPETDVIRTVLRPRPLESIRGERVAWFGTAPETHAPRLAAHLEDEHGARVAHVSSVLADREALRRELDEVDAETFVIELKAAAVDVVAEEAVRRGVRVVVAANDVVSLPGEPELDAALERLALQAIDRVPGEGQHEPPSLSGAVAVGRRRRASMVEGVDGTGARGHRADADSSLRARPARRRGSRCHRRAAARPRPAGDARRRAPGRDRGDADDAPAPASPGSPAPRRSRSCC